MQPSAPYILHRDDRPENRPSYKITDLAPKHIEKWFTIGNVANADHDDLAYAWGAVTQCIERAFPGQKLHKFASITGLNLIQATLPLDPKNAGAWYLYYAMPDAALGTISMHIATQHRLQLVHEHRPVSHVVSYDGRCMYASLLADMPVLSSPNAFVWDNESGYEGRRHGFYHVDVTVPSNWHHIGLVPLTISAVDGRTYPNRPGTSFETWCNQKDIYLLQQHGWQFQIRERMLFNENHNIAQPFKEFSARMNTLIAQIDGKIAGERTPRRVLIRAALRNIVIHTIGAMYNKGVNEEVDASEVETNPHAKEGRDKQGKLIATVHKEHATFRNRWLKPEWAITVWRSEIYRVTSQVLQAPAIPYESVLAFEGDAIYMSRDPHWIDSGKVGSFRLKDKPATISPSKTPKSLADLHKIIEGGK